jgi:ABC-type branched-subunit amino acid transport system substrate-binding protein
VALILSATSALGQSDPPPTPAEPEPFHDFRSQPLEYSGPATEEQQLDDVEEVLLGWFGPSGLAHGDDQELWKAAQLAVDEANENGGWHGKPFRLIARWSEDPWGSGVSQVARMAWDDRVLAILGSIDGATTHLAEQIVVKARLPLVSPVATDESINLAGVPWMFSVAPGDHLWAPALARALVEAVGTEPFPVVAFTDHDSRVAADTLTESLATLDRGPAMLLELSPEADIAPHQLDMLGLEESAAVLLIADSSDGARVLRMIRERGFEGPVFATPRSARREAVELAGEAATNVFAPRLLVEPPPAGRQQFAQRFHQMTGLHPDWAVMHTYDATRLLLEAIHRAGPSRTGIREALVELSPWQGVTGIIEWDPTGQNQRPVTEMETVRGGRLTMD